MEQQIDKGSLDLEQLINSIFTDFHEIEEGKKLEFPEIKEQSTVFIFLGSFNQQIEKVYQKYQKSVVMMETKYIKLVEIENYYLLHFPLILQYDNKFDARLDLFISKHHAESALIKIQNCKFHLQLDKLILYQQFNLSKILIHAVILDIQQIQGDDDNGKLDNLIKDSVFFFGKYYFKEENFGYLRLIQEDQWEYTFIKGSSIFDLIFKNQKYQTQTVKTENILGQILIKSNTQDYQKQEFINYGLLMTYLDVLNFQAYNYQFNHFPPHFFELILEMIYIEGKNSLAYVSLNFNLLLSQLIQYQNFNLQQFFELEFQVQKS